MTTRDPYDYSVAFDDIVDNEQSAPSTALRADTTPQTAKAIIRAARRHRLAPPPMTILGVSYDPTYHSFEVADVAYQLIGAEYEPKYKKFEVADVMYQVIGAEYEPKYHHFEVADVAYQLIGDEAAASDELPIYTDLKQRFAAATPAPKLVRLDTVDSYNDFRASRRQPYIANLQARLSALETAFQRHVANHHADRLDDLEYQFDKHLADFHGGPDDGESELVAHGDQVIGALGHAVCGGQHVPLPLADWAKGKVDCWQDGDEVLCTIRVLGHDGDVRMITSGVPLERHVKEVLGYAESIDAPMDDVIVIIPILAPVMAGSALLPQLCKAAPDLVARPEAIYGSFIGSMTSASDPSMSAAMAIVQRCQQGDQAACVEMSKIVHSGSDGYSHMSEAIRRLAQGQYEKHRRNS
jgi:hypothetical protein